MIETEFVKGLQNVIQVMRRLIEEYDRANMDKTRRTKRSHKTREIRHGQHTEENTQEYQ